MRRGRLAYLEARVEKAKARDRSGGLYRDRADIALLCRTVRELIAEVRRLEPEQSEFPLEEVGQRKEVA